MKRTLLSVAVLLSLAASAQTVNNFYPLSSPEVNYSVLTSSTALDESPAGANATWNFSNLSGNTYSVTNVNEPTTEVEADFPGTTASVITVSESSYTSEFYLAHADNGVAALTGASTNGIVLNYEDDNLNLGTFPKSFENTEVTDDVEGTFIADGTEGTFSGTATTSVDGYGTLTVNIGANGQPVTLTVTRLKIEQDLELSFSGFPIGTLTQVMYSYYAETPANAPVFRTLTATISLPAFGVNETQTSIESYYDPTAIVVDPAAPLALTIAPNPVNNVLYIAGDVEVTGFTVVDTMGRTVLNAAGNHADVSSLANGVYTVLATAGGGSKALKMVKQ